VKQLVILSGKGGTGKTSVAAAFAQLAFESEPALRAALADADVDAANLELVLGPRRVEQHDFVAGSVAVIDDRACARCGRCHDVCRFEAVVPPAAAGGAGTGGAAYSIDPIACEGCAACVHQCPEQAIAMEAQLAGRWFRSTTRYGPLVHAALRPGQDNSGKLVTLVKQQARLLAMDQGLDMVLVDGPPGIGCPVISAASGADLALIVTEPTAAGIHDMQRILATVAHFRVPALVCINKSDIHPAGSEQIARLCRRQGVDVVGLVPYDATVTEAMVRAQPLTAYRPSAPAGQALAAVWQRVAQRLTAVS